MRPYYQDDYATLYLGDCLSILPLLSADSVDLLLTDPPYGVSFQSGHRPVQFEEMRGDESQETGLLGLAAALRCLKRSRHLYVFGRWNLSNLPVGSSTELIWNKEKMCMGDLASPWAPQHEYIQFAVYVASRQNRIDGGGRLAARLRKGTVLSYLRPNAVAVRHPAEKPVPLLRELIESSSCIGETVLDPFAGVGSTLVAAKMESRRSIGIEIEEQYARISARRLAKTPIPYMLEI